MLVRHTFSPSTWEAEAVDLYDLQNPNPDVASLQETLNWPVAKNNILGALNTLELGRLDLFSPQCALWLKTNKLNILDLETLPSSDINDINLKVPVKAKSSVFLPVIDSTVDIAASLDLITSLTVQTDDQTGLPTLVIGKCVRDLDTVSISLVGRGRRMDLFRHNQAFANGAFQLGLCALKF
ncbi:parotid secretory protein [Cricetulus griseus]|uniref:Parotid secretory protein n=1 Tax=Cricetulus griseus TaxID=10029 RepID=A0A061HYT3_CRIGR|nr:parotid secretory protein [Cricetulus griseus]